MLPYPCISLSRFPPLIADVSHFLRCRHHTNLAFWIASRFTIGVEAVSDPPESRTLSFFLHRRHLTSSARPFPPSSVAASLNNEPGCRVQLRAVRRCCDACARAGGSSKVLSVPRAFRGACFAEEVRSSLLQPLSSHAPCVQVRVSGGGVQDECDGDRHCAVARAGRQGEEVADEYRGKAAV